MTLGQYLPDSITDPLDLNNLISEFSVPDSANVSLQDFYLGGSFVPNDPFYKNICNIPESGDISFLDFYKRKSYILSSLEDSVNEGDTFSVYLNAQNVPDGSLIPYTISGIDANDLLFGDISGNFNILNGSDSISFTILEDSTTEGLESLTVTLQGGINQSITISVNDTSILTGFLNSDFSDQNYTEDGTTVSLKGWFVEKEQVRLGIDTIDGFTSPTDPTPRPYGQYRQQSPGDGLIAPNAVFQWVLLDENDLIAGVPSGRSCIQLSTTSGRQDVNGGVVHGPYLITNNYIPINDGDTIEFDWRSSAYVDIFIYLLKDDGTTQILLNTNRPRPDNPDPPPPSPTNWQTALYAVNTPGNYKLVIVSGAFDWSFSRFAAADLYITNIKIS